MSNMTFLDCKPKSTRIVNWFPFPYTINDLGRVEIEPKDTQYSPFQLTISAKPLSPRALCWKTSPQADDDRHPGNKFSAEMCGLGAESRVGVGWRTEKVAIFLGWGWRKEKVAIFTRLVLVAAAKAFWSVGYWMLRFPSRAPSHWISYFARLWDDPCCMHCCCLGGVGTGNCCQTRSLNKHSTEL